MAGSLIAGSIVDADGKPVELTGQEAAKAWVTYQQLSAQSIEDSLNITSVVDNATGASTLSFINSFLNNSYGLGSLGGYVSGNPVTNVIEPLGNKVTGGYRVISTHHAGGAQDSDHCSEVIFGRLA